MTDEQLSRSASNLKSVFDALCTHYMKSAKEGRLDTWAKAAHSVIDLWAHPIERIAAPPTKVEGST
jgi:hypothetical protein